MKLILTLLLLLITYPVYNSESQNLDNLWKYDWMTQEYYDLIIKYSQVYNLRPELISADIQVESCGDRFAVSKSGAIGLMQVMPFHLPESPEYLFDPDINIETGCIYMNLCKQKAMGNVKKMLKMYWRGMNTKSKDFSYSNKVMKYWRGI